MLFYNGIKADYSVDNADYVAATKGSLTLSGVACKIFYSKGLAAKNMADDVYSRAYVEIDGTIYYSEVSKFSVLEYVHTMLERDKDDDESNNLTDAQRELFSSLLNYGAAAQKNFKYNVDKLANDVYYKLKVSNGTLSDGFAKGRYKTGDKITITANEPAADERFLHWEDSTGTIISTENQVEITVGETDLDLKAVYEPLITIALTSEIDYDDTVFAIGLPETVTVAHNGSNVALPLAWNVDSFEKGKIGTQTFEGTLTNSADYTTYGIKQNGITITVTTQPYIFTLNSNNTYNIKSYHGNAAIITLPSAFKGLNVTRIATEAFKNYSSLTSVTIPNSFTSIDPYAFSGCSGLTSVTIGNGVTSIGYHAFSGCKKLTNIIIPDSVTSIGFCAFSACTTLTNVTIGSGVLNIDDSAFYNCYGLKNVYISNIAKWSSINFDKENANPLYYADNLFLNNELVTNITIPDTTSLINNFAFYGYKKLTTVVVEKGVTQIGNYSFYGCSGLNNINFPNSITSIGNYAFYSCGQLKNELIVPDSVTTIGNYAFYGCTQLKSATIGNGVDYIGEYAFYNCRELNSINIPENVTAINKFTFYNCSKLTSIIIPDNITSIGVSSFENCSGLTSINVGDGLTSIIDSALKGCSKNLEKIIVKNTNTKYHSDNNCLIETNGKKLILGCKNSVIPSDGSVTSIGWHAFYDCTNLTSIIIPSNITSIQPYAFMNCSELTSINIPNSITTISFGVFEYCIKLTSITIPSSVTSIDGSAFYYCSGLTSVIIPNGVTTIESSAFNYCKNLTSVSIPNSVTNIGPSAFDNCNELENIYITDLTAWCNISDLRGPMYGSLNKKLYLNNELITNLVIPNGVTSISKYAFYNCSGLTSVTIPDSVTSIGTSSFSGCSELTSVTIPASVTTIEDYAFSGCSGLNEIKFSGTIAEWNAITKNSGWNYTVPATQVICSDGTVDL